MIVLVDKKPKDCLDCPCNSDFYYCNLLGKDIGCLSHENYVPFECPLKTIEDYLEEHKS